MGPARGPPYGPQRRLPAGPHHPAIPSDSCGSWGSSHAGAPGAGIIYYGRRVVPPFRSLSIVLLITFRDEQPGTVIKLLILIRRRAPTRGPERPSRRAGVARQPVPPAGAGVARVSAALVGGRQVAPGSRTRPGRK